MTDDTLQLYYSLMSQPSRSVFIFLRINNIPFESRLTEVIRGDHRSPEYAKVNPRKKIPALQHGNFCLTESIAMVKYLVAAYPDKVADHWYPRDIRLRARVDEYLSWQHLNIRLSCFTVFLHSRLGVVSDEDPEKRQKRELNDMERSFHVFQKTFLGDKPFVIGNQISVTDIFALSEMIQVVGCGIDPFEKFPKIAAWADRVRYEIGPKLYEETFRQIYEIADATIPKSYSKL